MKVVRYFGEYLDNCRSKWPRGLMYLLSSTLRTLGW